MNIFTKTITCFIKSTGITTTVSMRQFPPNCPKSNYNNVCSTNFSAWLPAVTVCRQSLFS
jgi:hypothetical protein